MGLFFCKLMFSCVFLLFSIVVCSEFDQDPSSENIGTYFSTHYDSEMKRKIALASEKDIVVFFGKTGAGKSTLINYLTEKPLRRMDGGALEIISLATQALSIGHGDNSCTSTPSCVPYQGLLYCDFPGFNDTRGSINDIFNAFVMKSIIEKAKTVRIVLVASWSEIDAERGTEFTKYMNGISSLIPRRTIEEISCLVITKVRQDDFGHLEEFIRSGLERKAPEATAPWRNEKVQLMYSPVRADEESYNQPAQRTAIIDLIRATEAAKISILDIGHVFSGGTRSQIKEVFKEEVIRIAQESTAQCPNLSTLSEEELNHYLYVYSGMEANVRESYQNFRCLSDVAKCMKKIAENEYNDILVRTLDIIMEMKYKIVKRIQEAINQKIRERNSRLEERVEKQTEKIEKLADKVARRGDALEKLDDKIGKERKKRKELERKLEQKEELKTT